MLTLIRAFDLVNAAFQYAREQSLQVAVVVVDRGGRIIACGRDDRASYFTIGAAEKKAVTSTSFGIPMHRLLQMAQADPILLGAVSGDSTLSVLPGGVPILVDGAIVAALGVAGAHYSQDHAIAERALAIVGV